MYPFVKLLRYAKNIAGRIIPENTRLFRFLVLLGLRLTAKRRLAAMTPLNLQVTTTSHCNLNCVCCSSFSPVADEGFYDFSDFEPDMKRLAGLTGGNLGFVAFSGGEPLLHPGLLSFFDVTRAYFSRAIILVQTNGILLAKQPPAFWENCEKNRVAVEITRYPVTLDFDVLRALGRRYNVTVEYFGGVTEPVKTMWKFPLDPDGGQDIEKTFRICPLANRYGFLHHGKIGCAKCISIGAFNARFGRRLEVSENDYIDIYKIQSAAEIQDYLRSPIPFCRYCAWKRLETGIPWSVSKKEIREWI
jgi:hypothetical protein